MKASYIISSVAVVFLACGVGFASAVCDAEATLKCITDWTNAFGESTQDCTKLEAAQTCLSTEVTACGDALGATLKNTMDTANTEVTKICGDAPNVTAGIAVLALCLISLFFTRGSY